MELPVLNLPPVEFRLRELDSMKQIFDIVRKKFVALTPEEWVRQHFIHFIISQKKYPASLLGVEIMVRLNTMAQRADIVVYQRDGKPWMIIECKSTAIEISEEIFYQAARYNYTLQVPFIVITNGFEHYCLRFNGSSFDYLEDLPDFD